MNAPDAQVRVLDPFRAKRCALPLAHPVVEPRQSLRLSAITADAAARTELSLSLLWRELARGTSQVIDGFFSEDRCYLVLALRTDGNTMPIEGRRLEILEAVLGGVRQKTIAIDLNLAPSTVALNSRLALEGLGVDCKPSRAHPLLMLAAQAVNRPEQALATYSTFVTREDRELRVVGVPRPDRHLAARLPSAELAVIRCLVEGLSYQEIARCRGTSIRTIANQISAVFRRLRVSGRNELVQRLFFDAAAGQHLPGSIAETLVPSTVAQPEPVVGLNGALRSA